VRLPGRRAGWAGALLALCAAGCAKDAGVEEGASPPAAPAATAPAPELPATRGWILISLDALRADRLGAYGYQRPTSPFFDSLAARGVLFERAVSQYPGTLTSHLSLFTGLYPAEHGAYPPSGVLSSEIPTLPELFRAAGYRTAGHTEGGFMAGGYGFARGFEEFTDSPHAAERDIERTFGRGIDFLRRIAPGERFFLFLHTFAVHDPYDPPAPYREGLVGELPAGLPVPEGQTLRAYNRGGLVISPEGVDAFSQLYDGSVRYVDAVLSKLFEELERLGLAADTTVVITSDHGEEFGEHGKLGHTQVYPECLFVPLLVVPPAPAEGVRVSELVELVDVAGSVLEVAGIEAPAAIAGRRLFGAPAGPEGAHEAYAEVIDLVTYRTLLADVFDGRRQLVVAQATADPSGAWITRTVTFDHTEPTLAFEAQAFHRPRTLAVEVDGAILAATELATGWTPVRLELPGEASIHRVTLSTEGCKSPLELGVGQDSRCLSFQVRGLELRRIELFDLAADPGAATDVVAANPEVRHWLLRRLRDYRFQPRARPERLEIPAELRETLRALGYVD